MKRAASEPPDSKETSQAENTCHTMETHASSHLLKGQVDRGELRSGTAVSRFQKAAKKVMVTNEVGQQMLSLVCDFWLVQHATEHKTAISQSQTYTTAKACMMSEPPTKSAAPGLPVVKRNEGRGQTLQHSITCYTLRCWT